MAYGRLDYLINNIVGAMKMKQVSYAEFRTLPNGTVFQMITDEAETTGLCLKGELAGDSSFWSLPLVSDSLYHLSYKDGVKNREPDEPLEHLSIHGSSWSKDYVTEEDNMYFIVWELIDLVRLRDTLTTCIINYPDDAN